MTTATTSAQSTAGHLSGVLVPVLTPFAADLTPDGPRLARLCRWLLDHGCPAVAPFGTTSEANSLSVDERERLLEHLLADGIPPSRLMPGTGCTALPDTVRLTRAAVRAGCAGVLMLPPFYYKAVSEDGLFRSFAEVIERVGDARLRVYLYHIPPIAVVGITPGLVERLLAAYPRAVAGLKDSSGDFENTRMMIERFASRGFDVFAGNERFLLPTLRAGGVGCITANGNVNAPAIARLFREWRSPEAESLHRAVVAVGEVIQRQPVIPALKWIVAHLARDPAWRTVRPPLVPTPPEAGEALVAELGKLGFEMPGWPG
jgi:4-hydroxy-tetrahydrodipicolinate synthase